MISAFACALACINASSRMLYSMGRHQFIHRSMGWFTAPTRRRMWRFWPPPPSFFFFFFCRCLLLPLPPQGFLNGFGLTGTVATDGSVIAYFGVCLTALEDMYRAGKLQFQHVVFVGAAP